MSATPVTEQRTPADRFMRRLLRVGDVVDKNAILGARRNTTAAIVVSGIRCIITYLLIPILAPIVGLSGAASAPLTIALSVLAIYMGISGVRRFWIADHRARWAYTTFIGVVVVLLLIGIVVDVWTILADGV
jgi:O-antigen/teichoic acid export membrane protein